MHASHNFIKFPFTEFVPGVVNPVQPTAAPGGGTDPPTPNTPERPNPGPRPGPGPLPAGTTEDNWATWPTTEWPITEWPTTEWPTDDNEEALPESAAGKQFSRGYYVAIGLGILLVIIIVAIVVGIVVYKMRKRRSQKGKALKARIHG